MKAKLIPIGNSRGVRLPKAVLEQCNFGDEVDLSVRGGTVVIAPARRPREGWEETFRSAAVNEDDERLMPDSMTSDWDDTEWTW